MTAAKQTYISAELDWAEKRLNEWKEYIDNNPINNLEDRMAFKQTAKGTISMVSATVETQIKAIRDTMKEYLLLLETVDRLRKQDEKDKIEVRGGQDLGNKASKFLEKKRHVTGN